MENSILFSAIMTATMVFVTVKAWLDGTEKRDVVLLGTLGAFCGVGTVVTAII